MFDFTGNITRKKLEDFADLMLNISATIGMKISARGWCYIMEGKRLYIKEQ